MQMPESSSSSGRPSTGSMTNQQQEPQRYSRCQNQQLEPQRYSRPQNQQQEPQRYSRPQNQQQEPQRYSRPQNQQQGSLPQNQSVRDGICDSEGARGTGWLTVGVSDGTCDSEGARCTGWLTVGVSDGICDSEGARGTGWLTVGVSDVTCDSEGVRGTGVADCDSAEGETDCTDDANKTCASEECGQLQTASAEPGNIASQIMECLQKNARIMDSLQCELKDCATCVSSIVEDGKNYRDVS
ncbi:hypothetical protein ACOMHN_025181 [Nucella lapillus]